MNQKHIQHLYNRAGFGLDFLSLKTIKSKKKSKIIKNLFADSKAINQLKIDLSEFDIIKINQIEK